MDGDCFETELCDALISAMPMNLEIYILGDLHCNLLNSSKFSISFPQWAQPNDFSL